MEILLNMDEQKKRTAAVTAVLFHIQAEEEALMGAPRPEIELVQPASLGTWSLSANQAQMMMRNLIQMRMAPGLKG